MARTDALGPEAFLEALGTAVRVVEDHAVALDDLEHPASPDGSPPAPGGAGTELVSTLTAAVTAAEGCTDFSTAATALSEGAARGATGRAGRAMAVMLRGCCDALRNADRLDGARMALALEAGAEQLAPNDDGAHPGGLHAVVASAADAALGAADEGADLAEVILAAAESGLEELERGPVADPRLAARGSVDAAAAGFLLVLDTMAGVVTGEPLPAPPGAADLRRGASRDAVTLFEVACRLLPDRGGMEEATHLEDVVRELADVALWDVGGDAWRVSVVTAHPGAVVEALAEAGRPREVHIAVARRGAALSPTPA